MTYTIQSGSRRTFSARILSIVVIGFVLIVLQASTTQAQWATSGPNNINNTNTGNVGIGTTTPGAKLDVKDTNNFQVTPNQSAAGEFPTSVLINSAGAGLTLLPDGNGAVGPKLFLGYRDTATPMWRSALEIANTSGYGNLLLMKSGGNVGIGTTSPQNRLTIARSGSAPYTTRPAYELLQLVDKTDNSPQILFGSAFNGIMLRYTGTDGSASNQRLGIFTGGLVEAFVVNNNGYVGIGTTNPLYSLDVNGGTNGFRAKASTSLATDTIATFESAGGIQAIVRANGNVGIGTTSPAKKLDVAGDINASGQITGGTIVAKYQDVAEWVESSQALAAGTVVVLDHTKSNQVIASSQAYDTRVAGVISLQPGITLGEGGDSKVLVATTGRVKVKVDATAGPIQVGDLLVTGDKKGVAKKSQPLSLGGVPIHRPGTLIGKALEPLEKGTGEILVLLSLQ